MDIKEFFKRDLFAAYIGIELMEVVEGYAKARLKVEERHLNGAGVCQGGAIFTLADFACAVATNSHRTITVSTNSNITFTKTGRLGSYLYAEAHEIVNHHKMPFIEVRVTDEAHRIIAIFTASGHRREDELIP